MPALDPAAIFTFVLVLIVLYLVGYLLLVPMRWLLRILVNSLMGGILLFLFNLIGAHWGLAIALNAITALTVGLLGIPGMILLLLLQIVL